MEPSKADFYHPYQPYDIQLQFMTALYNTIEESKVGIFESPTGTGKSLSLICGSLTWLRDHKRRVLEGSGKAVEPGDDPDWIVEAERQERQRAALQRRDQLETRLSEVRRKEAERKKRIAAQSKSSKKARNLQEDLPSHSGEEGGTNYLPEEYDSDDLGRRGSNSKPFLEQDALSSHTQALLAKLKRNKGATDEQSNPTSTETKIIFCSRTHSQLTQFVKELRRFEPPPSIVPIHEKDTTESALALDREYLKHLTLGSRKSLCINHRVSKLGSVTAVNEKCLDLQKAGVTEEQKCPFLPKKDTQDLTETFRDHALAEIHDIEDLRNIGGRMKICPYYASRAGIDFAEILTLPYPLLLQKSARQALGVSVKDHIVIIDEAHNLMDAIADTYSCMISLHQIETATSHLLLYSQKFRSRLKGKNRMYVTQIIRLLNSISDCLRSVDDKIREREAVIKPAQLLEGKGVDQIQPQKLIEYLRESKLAHKVEDYVNMSHEQSEGRRPMSHHRGALQEFQIFLAVLMNPFAEGRFFFCRDEQNHPQIRYMLLDPREHFRDIVEEARAVILVGGTMSPMSDYRDYLFSYLDSDRLRTFSFGHVVPPTNLFAQSASSGPSGIEFDFTFEKRKSEKMITELGMLFIAACKTIPDGVVAFFPSYDFLESVLSIWKRVLLPIGTSELNNASSQPVTTTIFSALDAVKPIFHEAKPKAPHHAFTSSSPASKACSPIPEQENSLPPARDSLLQSFIRTVDQSAIATRNGKGKGTGALLLSVINGSLSEGINFSDSLGRAVFAIGLPYPNPHSAVWKAKIAHVEHTHLLCKSKQDTENANPAAGSTPSTIDSFASSAPSAAARRAGREFYENSALRSVNQAIGRVIRHRDDYAAIILVDRRYEDKRVKSKLPGWIRASMCPQPADAEAEQEQDRRNQSSTPNPNTSEKNQEKTQHSWPEIEQGLRAFFAGKS